jgi:FlaA1/EpsC-like NDP-sugar epimerase
MGVCYPSTLAASLRPGVTLLLMENPVIILGAQAVGTAALDAFLSNDVVVYCLLDDDPKLHSTELLDVPVMGNTDDGELLKLLGKKCEVFVATEDAASATSTK